MPRDRERTRKRAFKRSFRPFKFTYLSVIKAFIVNSDTDIKMNTREVADRHEQTALMEPMRLSDGSGHRPDLADLAFDLATASEGFRRSLRLEARAHVVTD